METEELQRKFLQFIHENKGIIHKICRLYGRTEEDKQDLFQEITIQLWKAYPRFRQESKISTWMYRVALNTAISDLRKQNRRINTIALEGSAHADLHDEADHTAKENWALLHKSIESLTEVEKAMMMLYLEDKSYEEMEDILGMTQINLRVKMSRIKEKLRKKVAVQPGTTIE
ncbi:MAG: sigma-70 family RNA polymerase sigma factor [Chitinophagaceae bacterium]|nr:sigma-70 family RNA polymerase sigma factor [Chitinophagaceae bacterium]